jgi:hypothetical protein
VTTPKPAAISGNVLLLCITLLTCFVVATAALVWLFAPSGSDPTVLVSTLVGTLAPTIAVLGALARLGTVSEQVADVAEDTNKLANGLGDSKIRAAVADVLPDHMIDPASRQLVEADRLRRLLPEDHR